MSIPTAPMTSSPLAPSDSRARRVTAFLAAVLVGLGLLTLVAPTRAEAVVAAPQSTGHAAAGVSPATSITSGGNILYIKNSNVWMTSPDGLTVRRLTTDGTADAPYRNPSESADGSLVVAVRDRNEQAGGFVRSYLYEMDAFGTLLRAPFAPDQYESRLGGSCTIPVLTAPFGVLAEVSPDGTKIVVNPLADFYDFDCGGTFESYVYVISTDGSPVNGTITTGHTENLWAPEWLGSSTRLLFYGEFANADFYYDLGTPKALLWIAPDPNDFSDNNYEYPIVAGGLLVTTGWGATGERSVRLRTTNGPPPAQPTGRCDIYSASGSVPMIPRVAPDGGALAWVEQDQNVSPAVNRIFISPVGDLSGGDCSSVHRQLFIGGGSDPFWGSAAMSGPPPPTLSVDDVSVTEGNAGTTSATFTITRAGSTAASSSVTYATADGTATAGSDYTALAPTTVTFAAGQTMKSVSVSVLGDTVVEPDETFSVELSSPVGATITDGTGVATIVNDDSAPPSSGPAYISVNDIQVTEGNSGTTAATFTVTRAGNTTGASSVTYATSAVSAQNGTDFTRIPPATLNFAAGETSKTVTVWVNGDTQPENNETFLLVVSTPVGAVITDTTGVATIVNDDAPAYLSIRDLSVTEGNSGTSAAVFKISRTGNTAVAGSVDYATSNGTASAGTDYTALPLTTLVFAPGQKSKTVKVLVTGDTTQEPNETFHLVLSSPVGATLSDPSATATIVNDDGTPLSGPATFFSINDAARTEGATGSPRVSFTITRYGDLSQPAAVHYATANGTASAGSDYTAVPSTLVNFAAGQASQKVTVALRGDTVFEPDETFTVALTSPTGAVIADGSGAATIVNDDAPVYVSVGDVQLVEGNSGSTQVQFTITRSGNAGAPISLTYATANGTATAGSDYTAVPLTSVTFAAGQTTLSVPVTVLGDIVVEPDETFSLVLSSAVGVTLSDTSGRATITNDD